MRDQEFKQECLCVPVPAVTPLFKLGDFVYSRAYRGFGVISSITRQHTVHETTVEYTVRPSHNPNDTWLVDEGQVHAARWTFLGPILWPECCYAPRDVYVVNLRNLSRLEFSP